MSVLFHHYKELKECISEGERIEEKANRVNSSKKREGSAEKEGLPTTLCSYFNNEIAES